MTSPTLDYANHELRWDGGSVRLTHAERGLLLTMVRPSWRVHSYNEIVEAQYPDPDKEPEDAKGTIYIQLFRLKRKIAPSGLRIERLWGWGPHLSHDLNIDWRHA